MSFDHNIIASYVDGQLALEDETFEKFNPITGADAVPVVESSSALVGRAVEAANRAAEGPWGQSAWDERIAMLDRIAAAMEQHAEALAEAEIADTGKPAAMVKSYEIPRAIANFTAFAGIARRIEPEIIDTPMPDGRVARNEITRAPIGAVGVVAPWNFPLLLLAWKVAPALMCGNALVVKPSEFSPRSALLLAQIAKEAGLPDGCLNIVQGHGRGHAGEALTQHPGVDALTFTGQTATGEAIMANMAKGARPVSLELGGKNACIVLDDADLDRAVAGTARSIFENTGQVCLANERIYVQRGIFDAFVARLVAAAQAVRPGAPDDPQTNFGPLISAQQHEKVLGLYEQARADGAEILTGGGVPEMPGRLRNGYWVEPTLWTGLGPDAAICQTEVFGPCAHIAVFDELEEVVGLANGTSYGLTATIWTADERKANWLSRKMRAGTVWINCWRVRDERVAFGGFGKSGVGREGGVWSLDFYSELRTICTMTDI